MDTHLAASLPSVADSLAPISRQIWDAKYRFKGPDGTPIDATIEDSWRRVARAGAGTERRVTLKRAQEPNHGPFPRKPGEKWCTSQPMRSNGTRRVFGV